MWIMHRIDTWYTLFTYVAFSLQEMFCFNDRDHIFTSKQTIQTGNPQHSILDYWLPKMILKKYKQARHWVETFYEKDLYKTPI